MKRKYFFLLLLLAASCASQNCWKLDEIAAGDRSFDSSRLQYVDPASSSPLAFEMLRVGDHVEAFLSLHRNRLSPSPSQSVTARFCIGEEAFEEEIPLREGGMKLRLSLETARRLTLALQEGKNVGILIDSFEETLRADRFSRTFSQFLGKRYDDENLFKGLIQ